ncbi:MAG: adenylate/guanylate cyclase domain-containing protein [Rhodobacteraceae bacterium]|nr:adenylate/guanylate cyclase domain-containing protein [Paracoccaceae bacterium]
MERLGLYLLNRPVFLLMTLGAALAALPLAIWLDLKALSDENLERQADSLNSIITNVRGYYADNIVAPVVGFGGDSVAVHNYRSKQGAIPIPATLSLELGANIVGESDHIAYRFVSDHPFRNRTPHRLTAFERDALEQFRTNPDTSQLVDQNGSLFNSSITLATPVIMAGACVECHNSHPESPRQDWVVGDVRAIQTVSVTQPVALGLHSFKFLLAYLMCAGAVGSFFFALQYRLAGRFHRLNDDLTANNAFLADVSLKISKYLSPQIYKSIFSGEKDAQISTERKKLTVFFSDIKDFTETTEGMQPEELTVLLNEYFTEMSKVAHAHGATIDKFIGDAIVAFFGDPETRGAREDARACVGMALAMQQRMVELEQLWRARGYERPFKARMGLNTGFCNVGNFGSNERMDYTIIGAEANLAARLESIAEPGGIVMSYETYAHAKDMVDATPGQPVQLKGIAREVVPYQVAPLDSATDAHVSEPMIVDLGALPAPKREKVRAAINAALKDTDT